MKTYKNLFRSICSFENLHLAYLKARKCKKYRDYVLKFSYNLEENLLKLREELLNQTYCHGSYREFTVCDAKKRHIKAAPFRDRVVHHALYHIIEPIFNKSFIYDSYACRENKGTHRAIKRLQKFLRRTNINKCIYCLQADISKYFDSIDHQILLLLIEKKIKDQKVIWLIKEIINSCCIHKIYKNLFDPIRDSYFSNGTRVIKSLNEVKTFYDRVSEKRMNTPSACCGVKVRPNGSSDQSPELALGFDTIHSERGKRENERKSLTGFDFRKTGIPIGNLTSQLFANIYLNELDQFVKHELKEKYYLRYMDDFLILYPSKQKLHQIKQKIGIFLQEKLNLKLHPKKVNVFQVKNNICFLGYRHFIDYRLLKKDTVKRFIKRTKIYKKRLSTGLMTQEKFNDSLQSWLAYAQFGNSWGLVQKLFQIIPISKKKD